jgi:hypothetical protein
LLFVLILNLGERFEIIYAPRLSGTTVVPTGAAAAGGGGGGDDVDVFCTPCFLTFLGSLALHELSVCERPKAKRANYQQYGFGGPELGRY